MFGLKLKILSEDEETKQKLNKYYWIRTPEELNKISKDCDNGTHLEYNIPIFYDHDIKFALANELCNASQEEIDKAIKNLDLTNIYLDDCRCQDIESSGLDIIMPENITIPAKSYGFKIKLGIACEPIQLYNMTGKLSRPPLYKSASCGYYLYPRSSLSKTPLRLANSVGIIDSSYRGEIMAAVDNILEKDFEIKQGERLFQLCSPTLEPINYIITDKLSDTVRGKGGFGSTGK